MRSVSDILRSRIDQLGLLQQDLAARLGIDVSAMSRIVNGKQLIPTDDAPTWCERLGLDAAAADEFTFAVHLSWSTPLVRERYERLDITVDDLRSTLSFYEDKQREIRGFIDAMERVSKTRRRS